MRARRDTAPLDPTANTSAAAVEFLHGRRAGSELDLGPSRRLHIRTRTVGVVAVVLCVAAMLPSVWLATQGAAQTSEPVPPDSTAGDAIEIPNSAADAPDSTVVELQLDDQAPTVDAEYLTKSLVSDEQLAAYEERRQQILSRQLETESALLSLDTDLGAMRSRIERYEYVMANQELVIDNAKQTRQALDQYRETLASDIDEVEAEIARLSSERQERAVNAYMEPTVTSLPAIQIVLTSDPFDVSSVARRLGLVGAVMDQEASVVEQLRERSAALAENQMLYNDVVAEWEAAYAEESQTTEQLEANKVRYEQLVAQLEASRQQTQSEAESLAADAAQLEQEIAERNAQLLEIAEKRAERRAKCMETGGDLVDDGQEISCNFWTEQGFSGKFVAPAQGNITSPYGMRVHPIFGDTRMHEGQDYDAPNGSPVVAVAPGEVYFAGWMSGFGNTTMIDHGNGLTTLYAHQSGFTVIEGQMVAAGEQIGTVGSTGNSTGPHLHFETRLNDQVVDPSTYF